MERGRGIKREADRQCIYVCAGAVALQFQTFSVCSLQLLEAVVFKTFVARLVHQIGSIWCPCLWETSIFWVSFIYSFIHKHVHCNGQHMSPSSLQDLGAEKLHFTSQKVITSYWTKTIDILIYKKKHN